MPKRRVGDANEELRKLRNRIHAVEQDNLPLHAEIQRLKNEADVMRRKLERARRVAATCRAAFMSLVAAVHAVDDDAVTIASGKRDGDDSDL